MRAALELTPHSVWPAPPWFPAKPALHQEIASLDQPADSLDRSGLLLAQCRSELSEALDDHRHGRNQPGCAQCFLRWHGGRCFADTLVISPVMSMAAWVVAGFLAALAGQMLPSLLRSPPAL